MHPEMAEKLSRLNDLIDQGLLPVEAHPRLFFYGHKSLGSFVEPNRKYKCVPCQHEWMSNEDKEVVPKICVACQSDDIFDITGDDRKSEWECVSCKHKWVSEDGTVCPACGMEKKD